MKTVIFQTYDNNYNLIVDKKIKFLKKKEYYQYEEKCNINYDNDVKFIVLKPKVLFTMLVLLGIEEEYNVKTEKYRQEVRYIYLQNFENEKLVIDEEKNSYMIKKFMDINEDSSYVKITNKLYNVIISALKINGYKEVGFHRDYYISKEEVYNAVEHNLQDFYFDKYTMFEKFDYFDINMIKKLFMKYYNGKINDVCMKKYCLLMYYLLDKNCFQKTKRDKDIWRLIKDHFYNLSDECETNMRSKIIIDFSYINHLYNLLHNINSDILIYYKFSFSNRKRTESVYEVLIVDKINKEYWLGFVGNPLFDFEKNYIEIFSLYQLENGIDDDDYMYYDDCHIINHLKPYQRNNFKFNENLKNIYFSK